jgi:N-acetylmuramoyl-L-alanine amidase-like protein
MINRLHLSSLLLVTIVACHNISGAPPIPDGLRFVSRAEWGANAPVLPMTHHVPTRLTIHHTGTVQNPARTIEQKMSGLQAFSQRDDSLASGKKKPAWADVPYHYYVAVDGAVAEGREWRYVGDTNTEYNPAGHLLVVVEGNFETDTLTTAQRRAVDALLPALANHFRIAGSMLAAHRDFAATLCPGRSLYAEIPRLRALIVRE